MTIWTTSFIPIQKIETPLCETPKLNNKLSIEKYKGIEEIWECKGYNWVICSHCKRKINQNIIVSKDENRCRLYFCSEDHAMFWILSSH
jgi:hypothetical protein